MIYIPHFGQTPFENEILLYYSLAKLDSPSACDFFFISSALGITDTLELVYLDPSLLGPIYHRTPISHLRGKEVGSSRNPKSLCFWTSTDPFWLQMRAPKTFTPRLFSSTSGTQISSITHQRTNRCACPESNCSRPEHGCNNGTIICSGQHTLFPRSLLYTDSSSRLYLKP